MKSYIKTGILLLWILGGLNTFSQKKILTPDSYQEWKRIDNPDLSPDGKWVIYNLVSKEQSELYLYETATQQTFPIPGAETAFFWRGGKGVYYQTQDSIILFQTGRNKGGLKQHIFNLSEKQNGSRKPIQSPPNPTIHLHAWCFIMSVTKTVFAWITLDIIPFIMIIDPSFISKRITTIKPSAMVTWEVLIEPYTLHQAKN